jgi:hypothetical protein
MSWHHFHSELLQILVKEISYHGKLRAGRSSPCYIQMTPLRNSAKKLLQLAREPGKVASLKLTMCYGLNICI